MESSASPRDFIAKVSAEFRAIPKPGKLLGAGAALAIALMEVLFWVQRREVSPIEYIVLAAVVLGWFVALFAVIMMAIDRPRSMASFVRFTLTSLAVISPLAALGGVIFMALKFDLPSLAVASFIALLPLGLLIAMFPGWPVLQATSERIIGPAEALKLTRGIRLPLILCSFVVGVFNRGFPGTADPDNLTEAVGFALLNGALSWLGFLFTAGLAVAAWRHMSSGLAGSVES